MNAEAPVHGSRLVHETTCCIVGGGPGGVILAYLLAKNGVPVTLLEAQKDFDRDFRGDSLNPSVMVILEEMGLVNQLLALKHSKIAKVTVRTEQGFLTVTDYSRLKTRYPFITVLPQARFLEFITNEAKKHFPNFQLVMNVTAQELIDENGTVRGVRYRGLQAQGEVRACLTIGADGRFSKIRRLAGFTPKKTSPPMDVLWFRLPRKPDDPSNANLSVFVGRGYYIALTDRFDYWQVSYVIPKGKYQELRHKSIKEFRESISLLIPEFEDRVDCLKEWSQIPFLSVESNRLSKWYRNGLLLIGDAAHVMSSVGGFGINCAIEDAVVAANLLVQPLRKGNVSVSNLAEVQRRRQWPIRAVQTIQTMGQKYIIEKMLVEQESVSVPFLLRLPFIRSLSAYLVAFGVSPVHVTC